MRYSIEKPERIKTVRDGVRHQIETVLPDLSATILGDVQFATCEVVTNCLKSGHDDTVDVEVTVSEDDLLVVCVEAASHWIHRDEIIGNIERKKAEIARGDTEAILGLDEENGRGLLGVVQVTEGVDIQGETMIMSFPLKAASVAAVFP